MEANKKKPKLRKIAVWALIGTLACLLSACTGKKNLTKITFLTDWYPQAEHGGFYNALVQGYYEKAGLDVEIIPGGLYAFTVQRVANGEAAFGMAGSVDMFLAMERDDPVVAIGATMQRSPMAIMVHASSAIRSFEDLEGMSVAATPGEGWHRYVAKKYGLKNLVIKQLDQDLDAFFNDPQGIRQVFVTSEPFEAEKRGIATRVILTSDSGYNPYRVMFGNRNFIEANPEVTRKFIQASIKGWEDYLQDPTAAHKEIVQRNPEKSSEFLDYSWRKLKEYHFVSGDPAKGEAIGVLDATRWREQYDILRDLGIVKTDQDPMNVLTTKYF